MRWLGAALPFVGLLTSVASCDVARAQGTARSQDIETSIRAAGMGGAGAAVWWGEPGVWGNPAQLGEVRGVRWQEGSTRLVPELLTDAWLRSKRLLLGGGGLGFSIMGDPIDGLGRTRLDRGSSQGTDPFGNPISLPQGHELIEAWGAGISILSAVDAFSVLSGHPRDLERNGELSFGYQRKHTRVALAPASTAEADGVDWGVLGRISPLKWGTEDAALDLDLAVGFSILNANNAQFFFASDDVTVPASRIRREGLSVHAAVPAPWTRRQGAGPGDAFLALPELFAVGLAFDRERITAGGFGPGYDVDRFGLEVTLLGILDGRIGRVTDRLGDIEGNTYGFGIAIPVRSWGAVRYDHARTPVAKDSGLDDTRRNGWSVWLDPVGIWRDARGFH